jgi:hypothetical protein
MLRQQEREEDGMKRGRKPSAAKAPWPPCYDVSEARKAYKLGECLQAGPDSPNPADSVPVGSPEWVELQKFISASEAAEIRGVSRWTIRRGGISRRS